MPQRYVVLTCLGVLGVTAGMFTLNRAPSAADRADTGVAVRVVIDVSERRLSLQEDGVELRSWSVAVGTKTHPTPRGSYAVRRIIWNPRWVPPDSEWAKKEQPREPGDPKNPMGRVKIFFKQPDYYIHGTSDTGSLGTAASHGCVRMHNEDVIELARLLMEHGGANVEPGLLQRLINRVRQTREIRLGQAVPLRVQS